MNLYLGGVSIDLNKRFNFKVTFILGLWVFIFFFIVFFNQYNKRQLENHILDSIESISVESSLHINNGIKNKFTILDTVAHNTFIEDLSNIQKIAESFRNIVKENNLKRMAITTIDGTAYCDNGEIINISDRDYFKASMEGKRFISSIVSSKLDGKSSNVFSIPIYRDTKIIGVLWISVLTEEFYEELDLNTMNELGDTFVINSEGDIIAYDSRVTLNSDNYNLFEEINTKNNSESLEIIKNDFENLSKGRIRLNYNEKDNYVLYYAKLDYDDWWLVSSIADTSIKNYYYNVIRTMTIVDILIILLISIVFIIIFNKEKRSYKNLKYIAYTDTVTGGRNDIYLKNNLSKIINNSNEFAFISLEIINIKNIITMIGLKNTEFLLKEIYTYLYNILNKDELVVHSYLGEYKVLMKYTDIKEFTKRLENISFSKINENIKFVMGIYLVDDLDVSYEDMCSNVSIAKETLNNINNANNRNFKYMIYNKLMHKREIDKLKLEEDIKNGIENKEFKAWFQPKYGKNGKSIIGAEALVRWHKNGSIISPFMFVPICEANGLIKEIDELVFEDVCKNIRKWIDDNKKVVPICVNLSRSYIDKINFIDDLDKYIDKYKISKDLIHFEITESSLMGNENKLRETVSLLHERGFKVLVDDFGVGYSSIKAISYVEFDALKIDKSFVDGIGEEKWENIIKYTINLANNLGMYVVAEGIETEEQYKFILECNCDMFQGYYFNCPMDSNDFSKLI